MNLNLIVGLVIVALMAGIGVRMKMLKSDLAVERANNKVLTTKLDVSNASVKVLQDALEDQNKAVNALKEAADKRAAKNEKELADAKKKSDTHQQRADDLMSQKPATNVSKCDAANDLFNLELTK